MQVKHHATRRETEESFRSMKWDSSSFKLAQRKNKRELEKLKNHSGQHFNPLIPKVEPHELHKTFEYN